MLEKKWNLEGFDAKDFVPKFHLNLGLDSKETQTYYFTKKDSKLYKTDGSYDEKMKVTYDQENDRYHLENIPKEIDGKKITSYQVEEVDVFYQETSYKKHFEFIDNQKPLESKEKDSYTKTITNTYHPPVTPPVNPPKEYVDVKVYKMWDGKKLDKVDVMLFQDDTLIQVVRLSDENNWQYVFKDLPRYSIRDGHEFEYIVVERIYENYYSERNKIDKNTFVIINHEAPVPETGDNLFVSYYLRMLLTAAGISLGSLHELKKNR